MKRLLSVLLLCAPAHAQPSFDCAKATSETEKAICKDENASLAERDAALGRLYEALKGNTDVKVAIPGQPAWIKTRDQCGSDAECIRKRYDERLSLLAKANGDEQGLTGTYKYALDADTNFGEALIVREADGSLYASVSTVSGPSFHTCDWAVDSAEAIGDAWLYTGDKDDADFEGRTCRILIRKTGKDAIRIDSLNCTSYCGARGFFDETYTRLK